MCYNASDPLLPGEISKRLHLTFHILMCVLLLNSVQLSDPRVLPDFHGHPPFLLMTCKYVCFLKLNLVVGLSVCLWLSPAARAP